MICCLEDSDTTNDLVDIDQLSKGQPGRLRIPSDSHPVVRYPQYVTSTLKGDLPQNMSLSD